MDVKPEPRWPARGGASGNVIQQATTAEGAQSDAHRGRLRRWFVPRPLPEPISPALLMHQAKRQVIADQEWKTAQTENQQSQELLELFKQILQLTKGVRSYTDTVPREDDQNRELLSLGRQTLALTKTGSRRSLTTPDRVQLFTRGEGRRAASVDPAGPNAPAVGRHTARRVPVVNVALIAANFAVWSGGFVFGFIVAPVPVSAGVVRAGPGETTAAGALP
jgi:hypothetical protein